MPGIRFYRLAGGVVAVLCLGTRPSSAGAAQGGISCRALGAVPRVFAPPRDLDLARAARAGASDTTPAHDLLPSFRFGGNIDLLAAYQKDTGMDVLLREAELAAEAQVSPKLHGFLFLTRPAGESFNIEEAAATVDLPGGFRLRAGRYRVEFGYLNTVHEPERPEVTLPLPVVEFLGDEQLREGAITVGRIVDLRGGHLMAASAALWNGDTPAVFADDRPVRAKPLAGKLYYGFASATVAYQVGASGVWQGSRSGGRGGTGLQAFDARLLLGPRYNAAFDYPARFALDGEVLLSSQRDTAATAGVRRTRAAGAWAVADFQFLRAHHVGLGAEFTEGRWDRSATARAFSVRYSWYQTPHARVQLQARYVDGTTEAAPRGWQVNLQWNVVLGPHSERPLLAILASDVERLGPP